MSRRVLAGMAPPPPVVGGYDLAFNFRDTLGFVTDVFPEVFHRNDLYPTSFSNGSTTADAGYARNEPSIYRDESASNDRRLAGMNLYGSASSMFWNMAAPPGDYDFWISIGRYTVAFSPNSFMYDGLYLPGDAIPPAGYTELQAWSGSTGAADSYFNAQAVVKTSANWVADYDTDFLSITIPDRGASRTGIAYRSTSSAVNHARLRAV